MLMFDYLSKTSTTNLKEYTVESINCIGWESNLPIRPQKICLHSFNEYKTKLQFHFQTNFTIVFSSEKYSVFKMQNPLCKT